MPFTPSMRRKAFLVQRVGGDEPLAAAKLEDVPDSRLLKLTMPDGSEWLVGDETLRDVLDAVAESRAYYVEHDD